MTEGRDLVDELFGAIPRDERGDFLLKAGIYSIAPTDFVGLQMWREQNRPRLTAALLRRLNFSDEQVMRAFSEGDLTIPKKVMVSDITFRLSLFPSTTTQTDRIPLTEAAVGSAVSLELFRDVTAALQPLGTSVDPPTVKIASGSVTFTVAAAPIAAGVALVVHCLAGVPLLTATGIGGAISASTGVIDLALNWAERVAEIRRKNSEAAKLGAEAEKLRAEANKLDEEAKRLRTEAESATQQPIAGPRSVALSALVHPAEVHAAAERLGIGDALANHILNRGLPAAFEVRRFVSDITVVSGKAAAG